MFRIAFIDQLTRESSSVCKGEIILGSYRERFESPLHFWDKSDYGAQWRTAISKLVSGGLRTCLVTSMNDPASANFIAWWPLYRDDGIVRVQNQLLFFDSLNKPFSIAEIDDFVRPYSAVNEEGINISEWQVSYDEVVDFARHSQE